MKILWIFLGGHHKIRLYLGVIFILFIYAFWGLFLRSRYRMGVFLGVAKISNILGGFLKFLGVFLFFFFFMFFFFFWGGGGVNGRCWARAYV